jgi:hypothetical protein
LYYNRLIVTNCKKIITAKKREITAGKFKAKCMGLLDEVETDGQEIVVTKYDKLVAK